MYKKIKAIKNNSLKKSTMFVAMATLASCAVLADLEKIGFDCGSRAFAMTGFYGGIPAWNGGFYNNPTSGLSDVGRENFDRFVKTNQILQQAVVNNLSDGGIAYLARQGGGTNGSYFNPGVAGIISKSGPYTDLTAVFNRVNMTQDVVSSTSEVINCLDKLQDYIINNLVFLGRQLDLDSIKSEVKLKKLKNKEGELELDKLCSKELTEYADIRTIRSEGGDTLTKAKKLYEKALAQLYFDQVFTPDGFNAEVDDWSKHGRLLFTDNGRNILEGQGLPAFVSVMQTLLIYNKAINNIYRKLIASKTLEYMMRLRAPSLTMDGEIANNYVSNAAGVDVWFEQIKDSKYKGMLVMPLLAAKVGKDGGFSGVSVDGTTDEILKSNRKNFVSHLVEAVRGTTVEPGDLLNTFVNYSNYKIDNLDTDFEVSYDFTDAITSTLGEADAKAVFKDFDDQTAEFLSDKGVEEALQGGVLKEGSDEEQAVTNGLREAYANSPEKTRFVLPDGRLANHIINLTSKDNRNNAAFLAYVLAMPETLRLRGAAECFKHDLKASFVDSKSWEDPAAVGDTWINKDIFIQGVKNALASFSYSYKKAKELVEKVGKIKRSKVSDSEKEKFNQGKSPITNFLVRDTNNNVVKNIRAKVVADEAAGHKTIICEGLDKDIKDVRFTLCPQTATKSEGGKDKSSTSDHTDYAPVSVVNGRVTADITKEAVKEGNYELHACQVIYDEKNKDIIKDYKFLFKINFSVDVKKVKPTNAIKITSSEAEPNSLLDYESAKVTLNEDKSISVRFKCKDKKAASELLVNGYWDEGADFKPEHAKFALQVSPDGNYFTFTSNKGQSGKKQLHVYRGEIEKGAYDGKIIFDISDTEELDESEISITDVVTKNYLNDEDSKKALVEKKVRLALPSQCFDWDSNTIRYAIVPSSDPDTNRPSYKGVAEVTRIKRGGYRGSFNSFGFGSGSDVYEAKIKLPQTDSQYKIRIENVKSMNFNRGLTNAPYYLLSSSTINHATYKAGEELSFHPEYPFERSFGPWGTFSF